MKHNKLAYTVLFLLPALAACGQSNLPSRTLVSGTITALTADRSTITVAGQTFKLSGVGTLSAQSASAKKIRVNGKDSNPKALSVGQKVKVSVTAGEATDVDVDLELRGAVVSIDTAAGTLVVAGKTVSVSSSTRFDVNGSDDSAAAGSGSLASIKVGDFVEVTGATDAVTGNIAATKLEVKSAQELAEDGEDDHTEFKGTVSGFVAGTTSFKLKNVTVNCTGTCVLPAGFKDGDFIEVDGKLAADGSLTASRVKLEDSDDDDNGKGEGGKDDSGKGDGGKGDSGKGEKDDDKI
jgi:Domain of unknown function (DUF5666)